jgi:hypothetical protein
MDNSLYSVLRDNLCDVADTSWLNANATAGPVDSSKISQATWGVACTLVPGSVPNLQNIGQGKLLFLKYSGESSWGVYPLVQTSTGSSAAKRANQRPVSVINPASCIADPTGFWSYRCDKTAPALIDAGVTQIPNSSYTGDNKPDDKTMTAITPAQLALVSSSYYQAGIAGITASTLLRNALQQAEFGMDHDCVGKESEACMPSLTSAQLASVLSGRIQDWKHFKVTSRKTGTVASLTDDSITSSQVKTGLAAGAGAFDSKVHICARQKGTAVRAGANFSLLASPCSTSGLSWATTNPVTGPIVATGSANQFAQCMTDVTNGTLSSGGSLEQAVKTARTAWALGPQGTEKNANGASPYRFIKIDGFAPTQENVWNGSYRYWYEFAMNWRTDLSKETRTTLAQPASALANKTAGSGNTGSNKIAFLKQLTAVAGNPTTITRFNESFARHGFGLAGYFSVAGGTGIPDPDGGPYRSSNPVLNYSHADSTGKMDLCRPAAINTKYQSATPLF